MTSRALLYLLLSIAILPACTESVRKADGRWKDLSEDFEPEVTDAPRTWPDEKGDPSPVIMDSSGEGVWFEQTLDVDAWTEDGPGRWTRKRPKTFVARTGLNAVLQLVGPKGHLKRLTVQTIDAQPKTDETVFWIDPLNLLIVQDPELEMAPEGYVLREYVERGTMVGTRRRVVVNSVTAFGLDVWPGERVVRKVRLVGDSTLRFATACASSDPETSATFTVSHGDQELFRFEHEAGAERSGERATIAHSVDLPRTPTGTLELSFAVEGDANITAFLEPIVGPRDIGTYAARPWEEQRPNLIYFSADTLRADSLGTFGGPAGRTPNLDRLAEESVRFLKARSAASWTLTSQVSICTGLFPNQHGVTQTSRRLPEQAVTIAEHFESLGYRTGAVTDSVFLSTTYGIDQGFSWFEEHGAWFSKQVQPTPPLQLTLRNALDFLDRDDGRPVLLFIHTYRAHTPYRPDPDENSRLNDELNAERGRLLEEAHPRARPEVVLGDWVDRYRALYYEGTAELDAAFGPFWEQLTRSGVADSSIFCFMSDHGEAFYEHGESGHSQDPHEEQIHVPLLLRAPGLEPRAVSWSVSLIDLPRTFADLAGLPAEPSWGGRSLLDVSSEKPVFAVIAATWSVNVGTKKLLFTIKDELKVIEAYDLATDPLEKHNLAQTEEWPAELLASLADEVQNLRRPIMKPRKHQLSSEMRDQLNSLGYAGD